MYYRLCEDVDKHLLRVKQHIDRCNAPFKVAEDSDMENEWVDYDKYDKWKIINKYPS